MKILLINTPRSPYNGILEHADPAAAQYIHKKLIGPPLGLLTLAASVQDSHDVRLLETKGEYDLNPLTPDLATLVRQAVEEYQPDVVGTTFIASEFPAGSRILQTVKEVDPAITTIAGGLHATLCPRDFDLAWIDIVVTSCAGGAIFPEIIRCLETGRRLDHIGGIMRRLDNRLTATTAAILPCDPAGKDFIMPDRSLLKRWLSTYIAGKADGPSTYVFTSLGCPYRCSFCAIWPQYGGRYLQRDVESVISELKTLDDYEVVRFADANTLVNLDFAGKLFDRISEEGIRKTFVMDIRVDTAAENPALIAKLARGGLKVVICGFESRRQEELTRYNKNLQADLIGKAIDVFHANGIMLRGNYIIPPDYGADDFELLREYAARNRVAFAGYTILTPFPGTAFHAEVKDAIIDHNLEKYNMFNCVLPTTLPLAEFYRKVSSLWLIRKGTEVIS